MSRDEKKIEGEKRSRVIDLVPLYGCEDRTKKFTEVLGQRYRVLRHSSTAYPIDYATATISKVLPDGNGYGCCRCGQTIHTAFSRWVPVLDVLCPECEGLSGRFEPYCVFCGQPLVPLLPFEVRGELRVVWVCPLHHCFIVTSSIEGVE